jgi:hypothetical protein
VETSKVEANCKTVFYFDVSSRPRNGAWLDYISDLVPKVLSSEVGLALPAHPKTKRISQELNAMIKMKEDLPKNVHASLAWMKEQEDFKDTVQMYQCRFFLYDPSSKNFRNATEFFWNGYSQELDSWRDQPLIAYTLHHFDMKPVNLDGQVLSNGRGGDGAWRSYVLREG